MSSRPRAPPLLPSYPPTPPHSHSATVPRAPPEAGASPARGRLGRGAADGGGVLRRVRRCARGHALRLRRARRARPLLGATLRPGVEAVDRGPPAAFAPLLRRRRRPRRQALRRRRMRAGSRSARACPRARSPDVHVHVHTYTSRTRARARHPLPSVAPPQMSHGALNTVEVYDPAAGCWTPGPRLSCRRMGPAVAVHEGVRGARQHARRMTLAPRRDGH